jgi:hypothetical protein
MAIFRPWSTGVPQLIRSWRQPHNITQPNKLITHSFDDEALVDEHELELE